MRPVESISSSKIRRKKIMIDVAGVGGLLLIGVGCWLLHPASAFIVVGALLIAVGLWGTVR